MTLDQQLFELMCRAPAVPDWWHPKEGTQANFFSFAKYDAARIAQWPSAYARMVMEAAKNGEGFSKWAIPEDKE